MPAPTAAGRRALRASSIGLGLLVSAGVLAPPALAAPVETPLSSGSGAATVHVRLTAAPVPNDLDLSGARFDLLDGSGVVVGSCVTGTAGACDVPVAQDAGATYRLVQDAAFPVPGLVPNPAPAPAALCSPDDAACGNTVTDVSLFRTGLAVTVRDGDTQAPVAGAEYSLTGPDYRHVPAAPQEAETTTFPAPALSGTDGRLTFSGWFLPGEWALTPEVTPRGYQSSGVLPVTLPAPTADSGDTWVETVDLAPDAMTGTGTGTGGGPARPPVVPPGVTGSPVPPATPAGPPAASAPSSSTGTVPVPAAPPAAVAVPTGPSASTGPAVPTGPVPSTDSAPPPSADVGTGGQDAAGTTTGSPPIRAAASAFRLDVGVIGFGVLFLASVVVGVGVVRQRVRRR